MQRSMPGPDGPVGELDGLPQPPEFRAPRWFAVLVGVATVAAVALALAVIT